MPHTERPPLSQLSPTPHHGAVRPGDVAPDGGGDARHADAPSVTLAALGHGAIARVESVGGGGSLAPLFERLGLHAGCVVRCQASGSSTIVLLVGSRLVPIPRAWARAVRVAPFDPAQLADQQTPRPRGPLSREERTFAADASSRMHG